MVAWELDSDKQSSSTSIIAVLFTDISAAELEWPKRDICRDTDLKITVKLE